jgi:APA family basic amino acid/polyamine antiporter
MRFRVSAKSDTAAPPRRKLGLWMCMALAMGNMIGSGIFLLPASLGPFGGISIAGWAVSSAGAVLLALVFARLSRVVRGTGGPYVFARAGFGELPAFLIAWGYWISTWTTNAALAVAFVSYGSLFWPRLATDPITATVTGLASIWLLTWVNVRGVHTAGVVQLVTTILKLLPLAAIAFIGIFYIDLDHFRPFNASEHGPFAALTSTVALTLWAFLGLETGTVPADDVEDPERTIPRATVLGTLAAAVVYILGTAAVMGVIPASQLSGSNAPFADAARVMWGGWAAAFIGLGAAVSCFGALNGWLLVQGQIPLAAARDGLFPARFAAVSERGTPVFGLVFSSALASLLLVMNYTKGLVDQFTFILLLATLNTLVPYVVCSMAELSMKIRNGERVSWPLILLCGGAFVYSLWAIAGAGQEIVYWGFMLLVAALPVYVWMQWQKRR